MKTAGRMGGSQFQKRADASTGQHAQKREEHHLQPHHNTTVISHRSAIFYETHPLPTFHYVSAPYLLDMYNINFTAIAMSCLIYIIWSLTRRP